MKLSALFLLQLSKLNKIKYLYFQTSFEGDISSLSFCDFMMILGNPLTSRAMSKCSYLPQMMYGPKNKVTLFSSTLKVEETNVPLFFGYDIIWGRYELFDILWLVRGFSIIFKKSWNDKELISPSNYVWSKK